MLKNKIIGILMIAAVSMVGIGGCGKDKDEPKGKTGFTSIDVKATSKDLEAEVALKFEKGTKLDGYSIKFEGAAIDAQTKANSNKEVKDKAAVKLTDLGTPTDEELKFTVTGLKAGKITVSLVNANGEVVKDKEGKEIKKEFDLKAPKPSAEFTSQTPGTASSREAEFVITFKHLKDDADVKKYKIVETTSPKAKNFGLKPASGSSTTPTTAELVLDTNIGTFDTNAKTLKFTIVSTSTGDHKFSLKSTDPDNFTVAGNATVTVLVQ